MTVPAGPSSLVVILLVSGRLTECVHLCKDEMICHQLRHLWGRAGRITLKDLTMYPRTHGSIDLEGAPYSVKVG